MMDARTADNATLDAKIIQLERKGRFLLFSELETQSNKEWVVHNLVGHGEASTLYGKAGGGKSVFNGEGDRSEAERKAWSRVLKTARGSHLISGEIPMGRISYG